LDEGLRISDKDGFGIPFESNYEDTKISKSIWGDNNENVNYILGIGDYEVQLDNADYTKGKMVARYVLNVK